MKTKVMVMAEEGENRQARGVTSTGITARSGEEAWLVGGLSDYRPFLDGAGAIFQGLVKARAGATSEEVTEVMHTAVTDGTDQLRPPPIRATMRRVRRSVAGAEDDSWRARAETWRGRSI